MPGTTSTALPSFSHDQHHETDADKWKRGKGLKQIYAHRKKNNILQWLDIRDLSLACHITIPLLLALWRWSLTPALIVNVFPVRVHYVNNLSTNCECSSYPLLTCDSLKHWQPRTVATLAIYRLQSLCIMTCAQLAA